MINRRQLLLLSAAARFARAEDLFPEQQSPNNPRGQALAEIARSIRIERNIEYVRRPERTLYLHVYSPKEAPGRPLPVVLVFGLGAWLRDSTDWRLNLDKLPPAPTLNIYPPALVPRGYIVIGAQLRTSKEAPFPAQIQDCQRAFRWLLDNATARGFDTKRIGLLGASASGQLASLLAMMNGAKRLADPGCKLPRPLPVKGVCSMAGFYDFEYYQKDPGENSLPGVITPYLGGTISEKAQAYRDASPINYITSKAPPFLMWHGLQDHRVPFSQSTRFRDALKKAHVPVELIEINNYQHGPLPNKMPEPGYEVTDKLIYDFFDKRVKGA
jgi:acetyl esterase/lipase